MATKINNWNVKTCRKNKVDGDEYACSNCGGVKEPTLKIFFEDNEGYNQHINLCKKCMHKIHNIFEILETENDSER